MRVLLLALPALLIAFLVQAALWVPGYDDQGEIAPKRLSTFIEPSIGDARLLNPILNADTASSRIAGLVFDGLLEIDEDLDLAPRLARRWELRERVYVLPSRDVSARTLATTLEPRLNAVLQGSNARVLSIEVVPPARERRSAEGASADGAYAVEWPSRVAIELDRVVPDLERRLREATSDIARESERIALVREGPSDAASQSGDALDNIVPALERNPEITFWLRDDARFHDGHRFDSGDVLFTYRAIMDPRHRSPRRSDFEPIKSLEIVDTFTLRAVYKRLFSPAVSAWTIGILPEHLLNAQRIAAEADSRGLDGDARSAFSLRDSAFNREPVGTGAFRFQQWRSDEFIHLERNPDYFRPAAIIEDYYFRILPDPLTQEIEFRAGAVDSYSVQPHQAVRYRADTRFRSFSATLPGYTYVGYNLRKAPFSDVRMRRALGMAIDTDAIIRYVLFNEGERVTGPFANVSQWYDHDVAPLPYDPEGAARILSDLGYRRGADGWLERDGKRLEFNLITNNGNLRRKTIATIVQNAWQRLGIKCNVQLFEWAVFLKDFINPGEFDAVILGWRLGLDPDLYQLWHSSQSGPSQLNFVAYDDPRSDALIESIRREYDPAVQQKLASELHRRIAELQPYTFLFAPRMTVAIDRKIVMQRSDGATEPVRPGGAGDIYFHMNRWQKLAHAPD